jgi:hypothetical protein
LIRCRLLFTLGAVTVAEFQQTSLSIRAGLVLPAHGTVASVVDLSGAMRRLPGVAVEAVIGDAAVPPSQLWMWQSAEVAALAPVSADSYQHHWPGVEAPPATRSWDLLIDPMNVAPPAAWGLATRWGIWNVTDGDGRPVWGAFPGLRALAEGEPVEVLVVRNMGTRRQVLRRARVPRPEWGYAALLAGLYPTAVRLLRQTIVDRINGLELPEPISLPGPALSNLAARVPVLDLTRARLRGFARHLHKIVFEEDWMVGLVDAPIHALVEHRELPGVRWLGRHEKGRSRADPFGCPASQERVYCERIDVRTGIGELEELTVRGGEIVAARPLGFAGPGHRSYPYLFEHEGIRYCVPETSVDRSCVLFAAGDDDVWRPVCKLVENVAAADATIFRWHGHFWLAFTDMDVGDLDNLSLYYAERLPGPWRPHGNNPVKIDCASARPAGTPFVHQGALYRPAQDCRQTYGGGVALNRVLQLSPTLFQEETVVFLAPDPGGSNPDGLHTVSAWGARTLVDGKRHIVNPVALLRKARQRLGAMAVSGSVIANRLGARWS